LIGLLEKREKEPAACLVKTHLVNAVSDVLMGMKRVGIPATQGGSDSIPENSPFRG
jgi:hypothetical protein